MRITGDINDFMSIREACERWGQNYNGVVDRFKKNHPKYSDVEQFIANGQAKYFVREGSTLGNWYIHRSVMEKWYGLEK